MKTNGLSFCDIGQNRTISLLLVSRAVYNDALVTLYENKRFNLKGSTLTSLPLTPRQHIKYLNICLGFQQLYALSGYFSGRSRADWFTKRDEDLRQWWRRTIADTTSLQRFKIATHRTEDRNLYAAVLVAMYSAKNARSRSISTKVLFEIPSVNIGERWIEARKFNELVPGAHRHMPETGGVQIIPAVEELKLHCLAAITPEALLGLDLGDCSLVCIEERPHPFTAYPRMIRTYEMVWPDKAMRFCEE